MGTPGHKGGLNLCVGFIAGLMSLTVQADECVRSTPFPILASDRDRVKAHRFELKSEHVAIERFTLASGVRVEVTHGGCEYFVTKVRFESKELFAKGYSIADAYKAAASLLQVLQGLHADSTFDLRMASVTLLRESDRKPNPKLSQELHVHGDGVEPLEARVQIDSAGRRQSLGYLEVTLFRGPL